MSKTKPTLGIIGAGKLGTVLAQLAVKAGYTVYIAGSGDPAKIALSIKVLIPGAVPVRVSDAIARSDIVILALPLGQYRSLPADELQEKLVIDAMNYWWEIDGEIQELLDAPSSSEMVQSYLSTSHIVKALSHMGYHDLFDGHRAKDAPDRKAIAVAGDNQSDKRIVSNLIDDLGFTPVDIGELSTGSLLEPGKPSFGANMEESELRAVISQHDNS